MFTIRIFNDFRITIWVYKEHSSTIMCRTLLVEYYVFNNSSVYVLLIDASKAFDATVPFKII